jgi:hypothetical protein
MVDSVNQSLDDVNHSPTPGLPVRPVILDATGVGRTAAPTMPDNQ